MYRPKFSMKLNKTKHNDEIMIMKHNFNINITAMAPWVNLKAHAVSLAAFGTVDLHMYAQFWYIQTQSKQEYTYQSESQQKGYINCCFTYISRVLIISLFGTIAKPLKNGITCSNLTSA